MMLHEVGYRDDFGGAWCLGCGRKPHSRTLRYMDVVAWEIMLRDMVDVDFPSMHPDMRDLQAGVYCDGCGMRLVRGAGADV